VRKKKLIYINDNNKHLLFTTDSETSSNGYATPKCVGFIAHTTKVNNSYCCCCIWL